MCVQVYTYMYMHIYVCVYMYTYIYIYVCIYMYIHIYTYTCMYTHKYLYICVCYPEGWTKLYQVMALSDGRTYCIEMVWEGEMAIRHSSSSGYHSVRHGTCLAPTCQAMTPQLSINSCVGISGSLSSFMLLFVGCESSGMLWKNHISCLIGQLMT